MKMCPVCKEGDLLLDDEQLPPTYFCSNPDCDYEKVSLYFKEEFDFRSSSSDEDDNYDHYDEEDYEDIYEYEPIPSLYKKET